ncbi:S-layer homology domain-containing protein [Tepidanaerobacter sp. GT38]|uniref:S-layer homology domain-containing protein n=1 Tax=Tepidanaerobacter sp. GT38 TaxID=2722793 RepID=UPI001F48DC15|nr:S-layer homology domain-containing protein [Tepidanaerobacter sp. GT38]MCG1013273.1 S-layer homology domain-containing protein [Tepidanaerobacter sp. GT38]
MSRRVRHWVSIIIALTFCLGLFAPGIALDAQAAVELKDISGHWAEATIAKWVEQGLISGYTDGTFRPDNSITRAEFMALVNRAFGFNKKAAIGFFDVSATDWFYDEIAKAVKAGYISGYQDGTVKPNREISRQEAAVALCKVLNLELQDNVDQFADKDSIQNWSKPYIGALASKGYMGGYPDGTFRPERHITRAETVTMLDNALKALAVTYDEPGIYGPEEGVETISRDVVINVPGVTLRNMVIEGNLYLNEGIGEGDVTLENVTVKGLTTVRGGGKDSIHLVNFTCEEVIVVKVGGKIRIVASGNTDISELKLQSGAHVEGKGIETITILKDGEDVVLDGDFEEVIVDADVKVEVLEGTTINNLQINTKAEVNLSSDATVKDLTIDAAATITGKGTIEYAEFNADGAELEMKPKKYDIADDVTAKIAGKEVKGEDKKTSGGGGGGSRPSVIKVESVSLDKKSVTLAVYESVYYKSEEILIATIEPENATNKKVTWSSSDDSVATVTPNGLTATVKAISKGKAEITVKTEDGGKTATCEVRVVGDEIPVIPVSAISITTEPDKTVYKLGEELDLTGLVVTATYTDGTTKIVEHSKLTVSGFDNETVGEQQITVTYEGKTATFVVTVVEDPEEPTEANFISTGNVGIAPDTAGEAAGKIYAEYKLVANEEDISLAASNVEYIKVKVGEDGEWKDLTANTDATLWFNVEADQGVRYYEVKTKDGKVYTATLNWDKEINTTATWEATGKEGIRPGTEDTYVEYKLMDGENQVSLKIGDVKLIASKEGEKWVELEPNTDETLWFNKAHETGSYDFFIVTSDGTMYKVTLDWVETIAAAVDYKAVWNESRGTWYIKVTVPEEKLDKDSVQSIHVIKEAGEELDEPRALTPDTDKVMWFGVAKGDGEVTLKADGEYAYKVVRTDGSEYIFSFTYTSSEVKGVEKPDEPVEKAGTWNATGRTGFNTVDGKAYVFQEFELLVDGERISLHKDNIKSITSNGKALTPNTDHTLWFNVLAEAGEREFVVVDKNDVTYKATLNWTAPAEVTATAEGAPIYNESLGATYQKYNVEGVSLVGFDAMYQIKPSGEISKLVESGDDCLWFKVDADEEGWAQEEGDHIFLVKHGETWSKFVVNYEAPAEPVDETDPEIKSATVEKNENGDLVLTVEASDENLYSLEVDHSHGKHGKWSQANLPEFTVYADPSNPWGTPEAKAQFETAGVTVDYDADTQTWTITFKSDGQAMGVINDEDISNGAIEFYLVAHDSEGNSSGDMDGNYEKVVYTPEEGKDG